MKKSQLTTGENIFVVRTEHLVTLSVFCIALRNHFYVKLGHKLEDLIRDGEISERSRGSYYPTPISIEDEIRKIIEDESIFKKLTKKDAEDILKTSLKFYGREGMIEDGDYESSYERGLALNICYDMSREWVIKKYPHLKK